MASQIHTCSLLCEQRLRLVTSGQKFPIHLRKRRRKSTISSKSQTHNRELQHLSISCIFFATPYNTTNYTFNTRSRLCQPCTFCRLLFSLYFINIQLRSFNFQLLLFLNDILCYPVSVLRWKSLKSLKLFSDQKGKFQLTWLWSDGVLQQCYTSVGWPVSLRSHVLAILLLIQSLLGK